jgi:hypothetical protein
MKRHFFRGWPVTRGNGKDTRIGRESLRLGIFTRMQRKHVCKSVAVLLEGLELRAPIPGPSGGRHVREAASKAAWGQEKRDNHVNY